MFLSSRLGQFLLVVGAVSEHGVDDVGAAAGEADEGGVVFLALGTFAVVEVPGFGVVQGGERGQEQGVLQPLVPASCRVFTFNRGA